jgi:hypothetical protein
LKTIKAERRVIRRSDASMNSPLPDPGDEPLRRLLRDADTEAELPPRFQESVWRRIYAARRQPSQKPSWLESLVALLLRPAVATAGLAILMIAGGLLGVQSGRERVEQEARARYVDSVNPLSRLSSP